MLKLTSPSTIKYIMEKYGFRFSKSLGQNFLIDEQIIERIIDGAEVGPPLPPRAARPAAGTRRLQGTDALPADDHRVAGEA